MPVQLANDRTGIAVATVIPPALQPTVHVVDHRRDGHEGPLRAGRSPKLLPGAGLRLRRGVHAEVATSAAEPVADVPQREPQEGPTFARLVPLDAARLLTVNGPPGAAVERPFDPVPQPPGVIPGQDHEVIGVAHQVGWGPRRRAVGSGDLLLEPVPGEVRPLRGRRLRLGASPAGVDAPLFSRSRPSRRGGHSALGGSAPGPSGRRSGPPGLGAPPRAGSCRSTTSGPRRTPPSTRRPRAGGSRRSLEGHPCPDGTQTSCPGSPPQRSARAPAAPPLGRSGLGPWGCPQQTTPSSLPPSGFVTITHPHHPLRGQRVEVLRLRRGHDPDLIVRLPDGRHAAIALSSTDYVPPLEGLPPPSAELLLDLGGLRRVLQLLERIAQRAPSGSADGDPTRTAPHDSR
jgi:Family of unknown function (DUF5372)